MVKMLHPEDISLSSSGPGCPPASDSMLQNICKYDFMECYYRSNTLDMNGVLVRRRKRMYNAKKEVYPFQMKEERLSKKQRVIPKNK